MTSTTNSTAASTVASTVASSADVPHSREPATTEPPTLASILRQEAIARRHLTHSLGVELRRRLIPLVRANLMPLDVACRVLHRAGLTPLPRRWTVQLAPAITRTGSYTDADQAIRAFRNDLDQAAQAALGHAVTVQHPRPPQAVASSNPGADEVSAYDVWGWPVVTAQVRAETRRQAQTWMIEGLRARVRRTARRHRGPRRPGRGAR